MKSISVTAAAVLFCFATTVAAESGSAPNPVSQGLESLGKNVRKQPDNPGLQRATRRVLDNKARFLERRESKSEGSQHVDRMDAQRSVERAQTVEHAERPDRPERVERVGFESQVLIDRPGHSDRRGRR